MQDTPGIPDKTFFTMAEAARLTKIPYKTFRDGVLDGIIASRTLTSAGSPKIHRSVVVSILETGALQG